MSHIPRLSEQASWARWGRGARYINLSRALPIGRAFLAQLQHSSASIEKQLRPPQNNTQTYHTCMTMLSRCLDKEPTFAVSVYMAPHL